MINREVFLNSFIKTALFGSLLNLGHGLQSGLFTRSLLRSEREAKNAKEQQEQMEMIEQESQPVFSDVDISPEMIEQLSPEQLQNLSRLLSE